MFHRLFARTGLLWMAFVSLMLVLPIRAVGVHGEQENGYRVTQWTAEHGLPQNSVRALVQTRDGYLWVGTLKGLARFDGLSFKVFDHNNTPEMLHDSIDDIAEDKQDGCLWIGTGAGLLCYQNHEFRRFGPEHGIPGGVGVLQAAHEGGLWFAGEHGHVGFARNSSVNIWQFGPPLKENEVLQIGDGSPAQLPALVHNTPCVIDLISKTLNPLSPPEKAATTFSFLREDDGQFWLCRTDGLWRKQNSVWQRVLATDPTSEPYPQRIYRTSAGRYWVTKLENFPFGSVSVRARQARAIFGARNSRRLERHAFDRRSRG